MITPHTRRLLLAAAFACLGACANGPTRAPTRGHNVVIFVADGLRYGSVTRDDAPAFAAVQADGVDFANSHSVYPTVTTPNGSAIATGHYLGDTGNFGNSIFVGEPPLAASTFSKVATLENDATLRDLNARFGGNYLHETSLLAAARARGYEVAALGKTGPAGIQDVTALSGAGGIVIDDNTGGPEAPTPPGDIAAAIQAAGLSPAPPPRMTPNRQQQDWLIAVATKVLLPRFKASARPFVMVYWSADPDATQHAQNDSRGALTPGINGPTSRAAIRGASDDLAALRAALRAEGLEGATDVVVVADHGFSTVSKQSETSPSAHMTFRDSPRGEAPPGFLAVDLSVALGLSLFNPDGLDVALEQGVGPRRGSAFLGRDFEHPQVVVGANGGSDEIWLPGDEAAALAPRIVQFLTTQDYTAAIFVNDDLGPAPGALPMSAVRLKGAALTPAPAIVVSFRSFTTGCAAPAQCAVEIADTAQKTGQGIHGALQRGDTRNFMAAVGPDFRARYIDPAPVGNADIAPTLARILGLDLTPRGALTGRVLEEALRGGAPVAFTVETRQSRPAANGFLTTLALQRVGEAEYYDAAGAPGRAVGLPAAASPSGTAPATPPEAPAPARTPPRP